MFGNRFYAYGISSSELIEKVFWTVLAQNPVPIASVKFNAVVDRVFPQKYMLHIDWPIEFETSPYSFMSLISNRYCILDPEFEHGVFFDSITAPIRRIQKAMTRSARPRIQARRLALAMGTHERLGQSSVIQVLGPDVLQMVFRFF